MPHRLIHFLDTLLSSQLTLLFALSVSLAPVVEVFQTYFFADWQFLASLLTLVGLDTVLGLYVAWRNKSINEKGFGKFFSKLIVYSALLVVTHVLISFRIQGQHLGIFNFIDDSLYSGIIVREAISILTNVGRINPDLVPKWILKRLQAFDNDSGEPKEDLRKDDEINA
jgi:phage-related holin